ncbi:hypothetical protein DN594_01000, partial [Enterobacter cloacae]
GAGGLILGILGTIGGPGTLFKGPEEMQPPAFRLVFSASHYPVFSVIRVAALVRAAGNGEPVVVLDWRGVGAPGLGAGDKAGEDVLGGRPFGPSPPGRNGFGRGGGAGVPPPQRER